MSGLVPVRDCRTAADVMANARAVQARRTASMFRKPVLAVSRVTGPAAIYAAPIGPTLPAQPDAARDWVFVGRAEAPRLPRVAEIVRMVADHYGVTVLDMRSHRRTRNLVDPRQVAMYLARTMTTASLPAIGRAMGGRDHTTVLHGVRRVSQDLERDGSLAAKVAEIRATIERRFWGAA